MTKRTLEQVEAEIKETEEQLENLHGTETEVYARIVGYYRAVKNWNRGKRDEFNNRKLFVYNEDFSESRGENSTALGKINFNENSNEEKKNEPHFEFFMRKTCPNCPPVKNYIKNLHMEGKTIDVDTEEGLKEAARKGVFTAPTVIFYDSANSEIGRGHNVEELEPVMQAQVMPA